MNRRSNRDSDILSNYQRQSSESTVMSIKSNRSSYLRMVVGPEVKNKMSTMYRIESTAETQDNQGASNKMLRQRIKTILFFLVDISLLTFTAVVFGGQYQNWKTCTKKFNLWILTVLLFVALSLFVNFFNFFLLYRMQSGKEDYNPQPESFRK